MDVLTRHLFLKLNVLVGYVTTITQGNIVFISCLNMSFNLVYLTSFVFVDVFCISTDMFLLRVVHFAVMFGTGDMSSSALLYCAESCGPFSSDETSGRQPCFCLLVRHLQNCTFPIAIIVYFSKQLLYFTILHVYLCIHGNVVYPWDVDLLSTPTVYGYWW